MSRDAIAIEGLCVNCIVGVYPHERDTPQPLRVDLSLGVDTEAAALASRLSRTIDYAAMTAQLTFLLETCRFYLLETAAHALATYLLAPPPPSERRAAVDTVRLRLTKPDALHGLAVPSLTVERAASWARVDHEEKPFGSVEILHETDEAGIYRLHLAPGQRIPLHVHRRMCESEMILTDGLFCQGKPAPAGTVFRWPQGAPHFYENPTGRPQTILCVDSPPFIEEDEIRVEGEPAEVAPDERWVVRGVLR